MKQNKMQKLELISHYYYLAAFWRFVIMDSVLQAPMVDK